MKTMNLLLFTAINKKYKMENLFPRTFEISQEIINEGRENLYDYTLCIGGISLHNAYPEARNVTWGDVTGHIEIDNHRIRITTKEDINILGLTSPTTVTFIKYEQISNNS